MGQFHSYYLAKILMTFRIPSFKQCELDKTVTIGHESALTKVKMGRYSYTNAYVRIIDAEIGAFCSIGRDVDIGGGIHPYTTVSTSPVFLEGRNPIHKNLANIPYHDSERVVIGNDVWIGDYAYIKAGIKVGDGAVIGAHAVVTHDVEPYSIVGGNPAREIKKRFNDETISWLLKLKWWNWTEDKLEEYGQYFETPEQLLQMLKNDDGVSF